jgi:hypothetical protein
VAKRLSTTSIGSFNADFLPDAIIVELFSVKRIKYLKSTDIENSVAVCMSLGVILNTTQISELNSDVGTPK